MRSWRKVAVCLAALLSAGLAPAVARADRSPLDVNVVTNYGESETPRSAAMGGSIRAIATGSAGLFMNPAAMAAVPVYHIEALTQYTPETRSWVLGGSIVDSITSRLAGAFSIMGTPIAMDPDGIDRSFLDLRLGLAYPLTDKFILGVSGRYLKINQNGTAGPSYGFGSSVVSGGLFDPSSGSPPTNRFAAVNTGTVDAGLLIKPTDSFYIGLVGQNLTYANNGFLPFLLGGGLGYMTDLFAIGADGIADLSSWGVPGAARPTARLGGGAEFKIAGIVPVRAGYRYDQGAKLSTVTFGTGYVGQELAVEASVKRTLSNPGATTIFLSVAYYLESTGVTRNVVQSSSGDIPQ